MKRGKKNHLTGKSKSISKGFIRLSLAVFHELHETAQKARKRIVKQSMHNVFSNIEMINAIWKNPGQSG